MVFPSQEQNLQVTTKSKELIGENTEFGQLANSLKERSNMNPVEFERMQNECEHFRQMLAVEEKNVEICKSEMASIENEKNRIELKLAEQNKRYELLLAENNTLRKQLNDSNEKHTKELNDLNTIIGRLKEENGNMTRELVRTTEKQSVDSEQVRTENDDLNPLYEDRIEDLARLNQFGNQPGSMPKSSSDVIEKSSSDANKNYELSAENNTLPTLRKRTADEIKCPIFRPKDFKIPKIQRSETSSVSANLINADIPFG